ncbi:SMI1/KNR4 family protein [Luteolibacter sp. SL250]|uniref:SMI1/KNR4 family protein n=1 Tax=Luteolibacter sp. SL250 TaxID=2995170 RepID=UPI00226DC16D|nr:SMI1/KNR4 family protein [Luteolibacter sp. SL250]WAC18727.1 SMI1/KNR4 family protein [Luteolibacter sp. SL250]
MAEPLSLPHPTATDILIGKLSSLGAGFNPPADSRRIDEIEAKLGVSFPAGVREFYLRCDGITGDIEWFWDFFPLATLVERTVERRSHPFFILEDGSRIPYADLVCFCDVMIDAPTYVFHGNPLDPRFGQFYADSTVSEGWPVAGSFDEFVRVFVAEHDEILMGFGKTASEGK